MSREIALFFTISIILATLIDLIFYLFSGLQDFSQVLLWGFLRMYTPTVAVVVVGGPSIIKRYFHFSKKAILIYFLSPLIVYLTIFIYVAISMITGLFSISQLEAMSKNMSIDTYTFIALTFLNSYINGITINALYAIGEEIGWRGFLLDRLESTGMGLLKATIIIGIIWGIWHSPAIILLGYNYPENRVIGVLIFTLFTTSCTPVYIISRKISSSILPTASLHGSVNAIWGLTLLITNIPRELGGLGVIAITSWIMTSIIVYIALKYRM
ncbi:MAG: CPBP family glutamic-type intramembrane protease [Nitrososphaerota archaeon]|nr:CPBP family glutamic-type intramembrane protease [Nitrososphaerota archaeon]